MKRTRKITSAMLTLALCASMLGAASPAFAQEASEDGARTITDFAGTVVELPDEVKTISTGRTSLKKNVREFFRKCFHAAVKSQHISVR